MTPQMQREASKNASTNETKKYHEKLASLAPKRESKWHQKEGYNLRGGTPGGIRKQFGNTVSFFTGFGVPLDACWHPFRHLLGILGAFWPPSGCLFGSLWKFLGPPRTCRDSAENLPKFSRELAEVPPRIRQEPAKNPPYEPQAKLPFTLRLLRMDCVLRQTLRQNRRE